MAEITIKTDEAEIIIIEVINLISSLESSVEGPVVGACEITI